MPDGPRDRRPHGPRTTAALVAALATALIAAAIAGCGGSTSSTTTAASVTTTATAPTQAASATSTTTSPRGASAGQAAQRLTIPEVVEAVLTSSDPAQVCSTRYVTQHYLSAAYGGKQGCVQAQDPKSAASSVQVSQSIQLDGAAPPVQATAKAVPKGGIYDGEKLTVSLVKEDGTWKIDGLKSNAPVGP